MRTPKTVKFILLLLAIMGGLVVISFLFAGCESSVTFIKGNRHTLNETFDEDNDVDPDAVEGSIKDAILPVPNMPIPMNFQLRQQETDQYISENEKAYFVMIVVVENDSVYEIPMLDYQESDMELVRELFPPTKYSIPEYRRYLQDNPVMKLMPEKRQ